MKLDVVGGRRLTGLPWAGIELRWVPISRASWMLNAWILILLIGWLLYTAMYFALHPRGLTFAPSPFMWATGRPDPTCGLTRTFAWMWRADVGAAVRVYPLGPVLFMLAIGMAIHGPIALASGHALELRAPIRVRRFVLWAAGLALLANWAAKLLWLGL